MNIFKLLLKLSSMGIMAMSIALAGCSLAPTYQRPNAPVPQKWNQARRPGNDDRASAAATLDWQAFVTDENLRRLIALALDNNRDLRQTLLNVKAARAQYRVQGADRLPDISAQASDTRQRIPGDLSISGNSQIQDTWQAGVGLAAFELDLFGRVRNLTQAALQEYLATVEAAHSVKISLVAEVIQAYLTRDGAQRRYLLTSQTLKSRETSLELVARRRQAGTATALDYQAALGLTEQAKADLERIDRKFRQTSNALLLLAGAGDDVLLIFPTAPAAGSLLVQGIAAGAPSELLEHRPDILAAEHRLRARNADMGAVRAAFFPRISLTGFLGSSSSELSDLFGSGQLAWSFVPQVSAPIFDSGRNRANLDLATVRRDIAVAAYEQSIQIAFREVADALAAIDTLRREEAARQALVRSSQKVMRLSEARYRAGVDDYLRYIDAQLSVCTNEISAIEISTQRQVALVTLFRALGGGWKAKE